MNRSIAIAYFLPNHRVAAFLLTFTASMLALADAQVNADEYAGKQWPDSQRISIDQINHSAYDQLLQKYVDDDGMVAYTAWHQDPTDRQALTNYLGHLSQADLNVQATHKAKLAYWINAYNAVTIEGILRVYPTTSIRNHTAKLIGYNIWKNLYLHAGDRKFSLEDIEHKILRKMEEPRIHFAIVCASIGCPRLLNRAYSAGSLEQQLTINTQDFFARPQNLKIVNSGSTLAVSKIMEWYGGDFADGANAQMQRLAKYFPAPAKQVVASGNFQVQFQKYDWNLNKQK